MPSVSPLNRQKETGPQHPPKAATMNNQLSDAFSRKTDGTKLQKPSNRKFS